MVTQAPKKDQTTSWNLIYDGIFTNLVRVGGGHLQTGDDRW